MEFELEQSIEILERTPSVLKALLIDLSEAWLAANEGPGTFNPQDVVAHLIHAEETDWIPRTMIILKDGETRIFTPFDRFGFMQKYRGMRISDLLERFAILRKENVERLRGMRLQELDLNRTGMHPDLGQVTLRQLLATWTVHDLGHIYQIVRSMAKQYEREVGPWKAYIRILQ